MATPIAHKGVVAGAKVQALTMLDILLHQEIVDKAWDYFKNVQTKETKYKSFIRDGDVPAIWLNKGDHGEVSSADEDHVLRSFEVRYLPGAARDQISDGAAGDEVKHFTQRRRARGEDIYLSASSAPLREIQIFFTFTPPLVVST